MMMSLSCWKITDRAGALRFVLSGIRKPILTGGALDAHEGIGWSSKTTRPWRTSAAYHARPRRATLRRKSGSHVGAGTLL